LKQADEMQNVDEKTRANHGLVTRTEVLQDHSQRELDWMLRRGRLISVHRGVYRAAGAPITWLQRCVAALLAVSDGVLSHLSAARLHGLKIPSSDVVHVTR
jgi:predicted transcriptional regulator of viral defense system